MTILRAELEAIEDREQVAAVFHAAALCDFRVKSVHASDGTELAAAENPQPRRRADADARTPAKADRTSCAGSFPPRRIVGWKYELIGRRARMRCSRRVAADSTRAGAMLCVVNGAAYGAGFGFCEPGAGAVHLRGQARRSAHHLVRWLERTIWTASPAGARLN